MFACKRRSSMNRWGNNIPSDFQIPNSQCQVSESVLEFHDGYAPAPLLGRRLRETRHQRMLLEKAGQGAFQLSGSVPVNQANHSLVAQEGLVQEPLRLGQRFVDG